MKVSTCIGQFVFVLCLGIPAFVAWSYEPAAIPMEQHTESVEQQAVVTKIESDTVTLQSLADNKKIIIISRKDAGLLRTGDRVVLDGDKVRKIGSTSEPAPKADPAGEAAPEGEQMKQPTALPPGSTGAGGPEEAPHVK
jgi:hypothetical protein